MRGGAGVGRTRSSEERGSFTGETDGAVQDKDRRTIILIFRLYEAIGFEFSTRCIAAEG